MQPRMFLFPIWMSSVSIPSSSKVLIISSSAVAVQPCARGLPFSKSTFAIGFSPFRFLLFLIIAGKAGTSQVQAGLPQKFQSFLAFCGFF
jgi:hypothetical protein